MALLLDVPTEIIQQIVSLLPRADLARLCLTSHSIRYHAEPRLYSTIKFAWSNHTKPRIIFLLRTLLSRPELFALVDTVCLMGYAFRHRAARGERVPVGQDWLRLEIPSNLSLSRFISAIKKTKAPYTDVWVEKLEAGHVDAFAGLLIAYLSNTRSLTVTTNFVEDFTLVGKVLQSKALQLEPLHSHSQALQQEAFPDQIPKFTQLQRLAYVRRLDPDQQDHNGQFKEAVSALYLPNLVDVKLWLANPSKFQWLEGEPNLDHLTSLDIEWLDPGLLPRILSLTRNLRSLTYSWDYIDAVHSDDWKVPNLDLDEIMTAISPTKRTLEKLHIQFRVGFGLKHTWPQMNVSGSFNNLVKFDRIKELHVPFAALSGFGPDYTPLDRGIPPSVETLYLTHGMMEDEAFIWNRARPDMTGWGKDTKAWAKGIRQWVPEHTFQSLIFLLAESCPTKFPRLRQIGWFIRVVEDDYSHFLLEVERLSPLLGVDIKLMGNEVNPYHRND
ncbi:unnamed protein product [Clonostachys solani]|uniref:F-box domain-containing protein n=1 Tax=Clonostachys solani TaxID=160281 RepID=A0A9N9Z903_9HYPO|nr:unnamed protein product [Clonostachys solani]